LMKIDDHGELLWAKTYGGLDEDYGNSVQPTPDGGYVLAGSTKSFAMGGICDILCSDAYLIKTDENGDTLWTKAYGSLNDEQGWSVQPTSDGGYALAGITTGFGAGAEDIYFIKTNAFGNTGCAEKGTATLVGTPDIQVLPTFTVVGSAGAIENEAPTLTSDSGTLESALCLTTGIREQVPITDFVYFPNPAVDEIHLEFKLHKQETISFRLFDLLGRVVREIPSQSYPGGKNKISIQAKSLVSGTYFITVFAGKNKHTQRVIFQHR
jgi:Secretion system C-terminal sorting domain